MRKKSNPKWWTTQGLVPTPQRDKTPKEATLDVYYDLIDNDPNQRFSGLSENDVEELRQIMTEMDGVEVTAEVAWSTARSLLELTHKMLEWEVNQQKQKAA